MIPTFIGLVTVAIGIWLLLRGTPLQLLCAMLAMGLFEASAAVILTALSGSSIPPPRFALGFLALAVIQQIQTRSSLLREAVGANLAFVTFAAYGLISAFFLPKIFAGQINVVPMRVGGLRHLTDTLPLFFSAQNITTGFYMAGTGLTAVCAYIACRLSDNVSLIVKFCVGIVLVQAVTGIMGAALSGTPWDLVVDFVRNGSYSQVRQATEGYVRISGLMAEPSAYSRLSVPWMILAFELWLRKISPAWTGFAALLLAAVLVLSTSSTAYIGLAGYALLLGARFATLPRYLTADRVVPLAICVMLGVIMMLGLILFYGPAADAFAEMVDQMTVGKSSSDSGQQRMFWAMQGINAFTFSMGLGIGAGSFRSSSLIMAIIGSMGVIGIVTFVASCAVLFLPRKPMEDKTRQAISEATAWAAVAGLIPAMVMLGAPDPGMEFAAFAGISLALRRPALEPLGARASKRQAGRAILPPKAPAIPQSGGWRRSAR
ncbi:MAG: glycoside hydrolase [Novosphingobium sp.]